jgi:ABC-type branched-subunit amino acid transport system substrate-binding protein
MLANTVGQEMVREADSWYLIYSDYTWGQTAQQAVTRTLENRDKTVVGTSAAPFPSDDYSQFLNRADNADADGVGLLIAGLDLRKAVTQLIDKGMRDRYSYAMHQLEDVVFWGLDEDKASVLDVAGQVWGPGSPGGDEFKRRVADNYDTDPYVRHFLGYVAMDQAVRATQRAGSVTAPDMRDALRGHEVTSPAKDIKGGGKMYWRECDHQLIQSTYSVRARSTGEMTNDPYREWFSTEATLDGDEVARTCADTGCSF